MLESLLEPWVPPMCASCGAHGLVICDQCRLQLTPIGAIRPPRHCTSAWAAFVYDESARRVIHAYKFNRRHTLAGWLADCIVATAPSSIRRPDLVTWVPASRRKRAARGFDQAQLLAEAVADRIAIPCCQLLARHDWGSQTRRSRHQRQNGPTLRVLPVSLPTTNGPRPDAGVVTAPVVNVLVVDDVTTTGASLSAAAYALRSASFGEITTATAARSGQDARATPT